MKAAIEAIRKKSREISRQGNHILHGGIPNAVAEATRKYQVWYASCLGLVEANMPSRVAELVERHQRVSITDAILRASANSSDVSLRNAFQEVRGSITHIAAIVESIPDYLEARLHNLELVVATMYVNAQIGEAEILLNAGHVRAGGAIAGVLLERHLKLLCDRQAPPLPYPANAAISRVNDVLKNANVYDVAQWRKVQWMGDIRNQCDHAGSVDPRREDVQDLIAEVRKFVDLFSA